MKPIILAINDLDYGGGQRTVIEEAHELIRRGREVYVITTLKGGKMGLRSNLKLASDHIIHFSFSSIVDVSAYRALFSFLRVHRNAVIVSNLFFTNTIVRSASFFFPSLTVIVREGNIPTEKSIFVYIIDAVLSFRSSYVIGNSERVTKSLGVSALFSKKKTVYNGIEKRFFTEHSTEERAAIRSELGLLPTDICVMTVGSLVPKKGVSVLLESLLNIEGVKAIVIGEGPERANLEAQARKRVIPVSFLGSRNDIDRLLVGADMFVLPSLWEGMPNALLEAMASGLPCIATDVGGVSEVLTHHKTGIVVNANDVKGLHDAILQLSKDADLRLALGKGARAKAETMTWGAHVDKLLQIM